MPTDPFGITPMEQTVEEGEDVDIYCLLDPPNCFYFNEKDLPSNVLVSSLKNAITIEGVRASNEGHYECTGKDALGAMTRSRMKLLVKSWYHN